MNIMALLNALPGSIAQGLIWGVFAIGVYITFKVLDFADMTVDGSIATGGSVAVMMMLSGHNVAVALVAATIVGMLVHWNRKQARFLRTAPRRRLAIRC